jgi:hypothetical protein
MPNLRFVLQQSPAIAISAAALVLAAGTGVGFAATSAQSAPATSTTPAVHAAATTLNWHPLPLGKGWSGSLKYAVSNGVVYLSGSAGKSGQTSVMTTLPAGARPASSQQDIPVATSGAVVGIIQLLHDGTIFPFDTTHDYSFVSLSGVSFGLGS